MNNELNWNWRCPTSPRPWTLGKSLLSSLFPLGRCGAAKIARHSLVSRLSHPPGCYSIFLSVKKLSIDSKCHGTTWIQGGHVEFHCHWIWKTWHKVRGVNKKRTVYFNSQVDRKRCPPLFHLTVSFSWFFLVVCLTLDKVNRCLARYSPRTTTTNQPTHRAPNKPTRPICAKESKF